MSTHIHVPARPLSEFVDLFWLTEEYAPPHRQERLMPSGMMNLVVTWDGNGTFWSGGVSGVHTKAMMSRNGDAVQCVRRQLQTGRSVSVLADAGRRAARPLRPARGGLGTESGRCLRRSYACAPARKFQIVERALLAAAHGGFDRHRAVQYQCARLATPRVRVPLRRSSTRSG